MASLIVAGGYLAYDKIQKSRTKRKARKASEATNLTEQEAQNAERFVRLNGPVDATASSSSSNPSITIDGTSQPPQSNTSAPTNGGRPRGRPNRSQSASLPRTGRSGSRFREEGLASPAQDSSRGRRSFDSRAGLVHDGGGNSARPAMERQSSSYYGSDREDESDDEEGSRERRARQSLGREEPNLWAEPPPNYEELFGREGRKAGLGTGPGR